MTPTPFTTTRLGKLYPRDPLPVVTEATTYYPAGAITFGVEGRALYADGASAPWAGGPTLHIFDTASGLEHLRFDAFPGEEHYHYLTPGVQNHWVGFDTVADGNFVDWILDRVRTRLPQLLRFAGAGDLAVRVDPAQVTETLEAVETHLRSRELRIDRPRGIVADELAARLAARDEIAVVDVRERGAVQQAGTLLLAASIPLSELEFRIRRFIPRPGTPIVLIDDGDGTPAGAAAAALTRLGYRDVAVLTGGTAAWAAAGHELYTSVQALGQSFGEFLERAEKTPHATVEEVRALAEAGADVLFLDSRPLDEFTEHSLPEGISAPGAEIVARGLELVRSPETVVVVNCAGRTRSIVGAQALINAGLPNRVVALEGGTMSWSLAGHRLASGLHHAAPPPAQPLGPRHTDAVTRLSERFGIDRIDWETARSATTATDRTGYLIDVRTPEEYAAEHVEGSLSTPSWDIAPWVFRHLATLNARIVVIDDGAGLRAALTGSWLIQLGWHDVSILLLEDVPADKRRGGPEPVTTPAVPAGVVAVDPAELHAASADHLVIDLARSDIHATGHIPGARFATRSWLLTAARNLPGTGPIVLTSPDGVLAALASAELTGRVDRPVLALSGGTNGWAAAGLTLESQLTDPLAPVQDRALSPWQQADRHAAFRDYLSWEIALVDQLDQDATTPFSIRRS